MCARIVKDADERREELLQTALDLFAERGYENTPVQAITEAVGVAKGTFYHYFESKEDLLNELVFHYSKRLLADARTRITESQGDAVEKLRNLFGGVAQAKMDMVLVALPMGRMLSRPENRATLERVIDEVVAQIKDLVEEIVQQGVEEGQFQVGRADLTAEIVLSLLLGMGRLSWPTRMRMDDPEVVAGFFDLIEAFEEAMGRILGVAEGRLALYDVDSLKRGLSTGTKEAE